MTNEVQAWQLAEMQKDLERLSNQARFVQMIIDNKLIISKKKKPVLIAELKKLNFKGFPKIADAVKEGELEPIADNEESEEDVEMGANAYDYLLGVSRAYAHSLTISNLHRCLYGL